MNRRERKKEMTKDNIIDCALKLFKEKGFQETFMEEIAEHSDVSKGTLYNYFQDKESILVAYFQTTIADYTIEINEKLTENVDIKAQLNNLLDFTKHIFHKDMELAVIYFKYRVQSLFSSNPFDNPQRSGLESLILQVIKEAQDKKEIRTDISPMIMARNFEFLYINYFISCIYENEIFNSNTFKGEIIEMFMNGAKEQ